MNLSREIGQEYIHVRIVTVFCSGQSRETGELSECCPAHLRASDEIPSIPIYHWGVVGHVCSPSTEKQGVEAGASLKLIEQPALPNQ